MKKVRVGDMAGVGCMVDSCGACGMCHGDHEQFCERGNAATYNGTEMDRVTPTYGGYAQQIVGHRALRARGPVQPRSGRCRTALLCAGITTYSPLARAGVRRPASESASSDSVGSATMAVKIAAAIQAPRSRC